MALTLKGSQLGLRLCQTAPVPALQHLQNYSSEVSHCITGTPELQALALGGTQLGGALRGAHLGEAL